jgi:nitrite reductase/ring-hydroxylating ferredoxin subunit
MGDRFPFPIPDGWFAVAWSGDVAPGDLRPLRCFGRDWVIYRTQGGEAGVMDAFCPHLGAHLGHGGCVEGETVVCPFHGWAWASDGRCAEIPYAKRIPPSLEIGRLPVCERNGAIFAWHHAAGAEPDWEVPELPEFVDPGWTTPEPFEMELATCCQELGENAHDPAHFVTVHGVPNPPDSEIAFEGRTKISINCGSFETPRGPVETLIRGESLGLGLGITRVSGITDMCFLAMNTPLDEENLKLRWSFTVPKTGDSDRAEGVGRAFMNEFMRQLEQDRPIWENKRYAARPKLCDGDGPIAEYRKWASQFYSQGTAGG